MNRQKHLIIILDEICVHMIMTSNVCRTWGDVSCIRLAPFHVYMVSKLTYMECADIYCKCLPSPQKEHNTKITGLSMKQNNFGNSSRNLLLLLLSC